MMYCGTSSRVKMYGHELPFHIQEEIMKRLPVKSLVRFRSVSKAWKSLIDSSDFIAAHCVHSHTQPQHLLVSYEYPTDENHFVCYIDDDTFPHQRSVPTLPPSIKKLSCPTVVGSSHGLVCLYGYVPNSTTKMAVIWNPSIRKFIVSAVPRKSDVGFGVCPITRDPKIVSITQTWNGPNIQPCYQCEVMVYTLSSGKWRSLSANLPTKPLDYICTVTDRFIYWRVECRTHNMIMSFDVTNESFELIDLPDSLAYRYTPDFYISKVRESLALFQYREHNCDVWMMMEHGDQRFFTKLFTMKTPCYIVGFTKSCVPIMRLTDDNPYDYYRRSKLVVYEPNSEHNNVLESSGLHDGFDVHSYKETLLLLGRSDCSSY